MRERVSNRGSVQEYPAQVICEFGRNRKFHFPKVLVLDLKTRQKGTLFGTFSGRVGGLMESVHFEGNIDFKATQF